MRMILPGSRRSTGRQFQANGDEIANAREPIVGVLNKLMSFKFPPKYEKGVTGITKIDWEAVPSRRG